MIENVFLAILVTPFVWVCFLALTFFLRINIREDYLSSLVKYLSLFMSILGIILFSTTFFHSPAFMMVNYPNWINVGDHPFKLGFVVDLLGATYALLSSLLIGIIFRFSRNYLHKESGYFRFIFLLSILLFGLILVSFSRSLDLLFAGWELVGTTSVLLISYFYMRPQPVKHAFKAIVSYRICDMGILAAAAWAHHYLHSTDFILMRDHIPHAHGGVALVFIGIFIIWASLAKSAQLPMSSWLPTAMEGPTPSSAIFYGALSIHLGPFLLLRFYDYFTFFPILFWPIGVIGATTAIYASLVGRTRSDAKTMLAYSTMTQVGLIWVEIALGFTNFALFHIITNASLRTWQFLRSSSVIQDFFENPVVKQDQFIERKLSVEKIFSLKVRRILYIHAMHGMHLDFFTQKFISGFCYPFKLLMSIEKKFMDWDNSLIKKILRKDSL